MRCLNPETKEVLRTFSSVAQAAGALGVSRATIRGLHESGRVRDGGVWVVDGWSTSREGPV